MLESAAAIRDYMAGISAEAFWLDGQKRDAVTMRIGVIGEAARHVSTETASKLKGIAFPQIRAMRNRITHDYKGIDFREVWNAVQNDILPLIGALGAHLGAHPPPPVPAGRNPKPPLVS
jgi:uncharacterized protein with HEPN domain